MRLEKVILLSALRDKPDMLDDVEDPYVMLLEDTPTSIFSENDHHEMLSTINRLFVQGWETVNLTYMGSVRIAVLLLNPRAKVKYQPRQD
jgi:hypothetical protein